MTIDRGRGLTFRADYPIPGVDQSSQQFRDNFAIIKGAVESLQRASSTSGSVLSLTTSVADNGDVQMAFAFPSTTGLRAPISATSPAAGSIRYDTATSRLQVHNGTAWQTLMVSTGSFVSGIVGSNGIVVTGGGTDNSTVTVSTNAVTTNTANTIVLRNASGNFSAGTITAALSGNATTATTLQTARTISLGNHASGSASFNGSANITIPMTLSATGVVAGTYTQVVVDATGRVTSGSGGAGTITLGGDATGTGSSSINVTLVNTGVVAGTYSRVAVDAKGRVTQGIALALSGDATSTPVASGLQVTLANSGVTAGTYNTVVVDSKGRVTSGNFVAGGAAITLAGDATGTGTGTVNVTLASTGVVVGTYTRVGVDAKGRVTVGMSLTNAEVSAAIGTTSLDYQANRLLVGRDGSNEFWLRGRLGTEPNARAIGIVTDANGTIVNTVNIATGGTTRLSLSTTTLTVATSLTPSATNTFAMGSSGARFSTIFATTFDGTATAAQYADVAERYEADAVYEPGTVVVFGGEKEITTSSVSQDVRVAGVVSTAPAYMMNSGAGSDATHPYVALLGRVPCKVVGTVRKGDILVCSGVPGHASATSHPQLCAVIGKALSEFIGPGTGVVEISVQRC